MTVKLVVFDLDGVVRDATIKYILPNSIPYVILRYNQEKDSL